MPNLSFNEGRKSAYADQSKRQTCELAEKIHAIVYLHEREPAILHRNIKSENVLLDLNDHACLSDVGLAKFLPQPSVASGKKLNSSVRSRLHGALLRQGWSGL